MNRIGGEDRVATAIKVYETHRSAFTSSTAFIARSDVYADSLSATPLAAALKAPVLATQRDALDSRVAEAIKRQSVTKVVLVGGQAALSPAVENSLKAAGVSVERIAGQDRYETALKIADAVIAAKGGATGAGQTANGTVLGAAGEGSVPVFLATGTNFADAMAAGSAAAARGGVVLLTQGNRVTGATLEFLKSGKAASVTSVGGPAVAAANAAGVPDTEIIGANRYDTATKLAQLVFTNPGVVVITSGESFADSLAGGALAGILGAPMIFTPQGSTNPATTAYLTTVKPNAVVLGGPSAVSDAVVGAVTSVTGAPAPSPTPTPTPGMITDSGGGSTTPTVTGPSITQQPQSVQVGKGVKAVFTVAFSETESVTYQWETQNAEGAWVNESGGTGGTTATYTTATTADAQLAKSFRVKITHADKTYYSNRATLTVDSAKDGTTTAVTASPDSSLKVGTEITLTAAITKGASTPLTDGGAVQFYKNGATLGTPVEAEDGAFTTNFTPDAIGDYAITAKFISATAGVADSAVSPVKNLSVAGKDTSVAIGGEAGDWSVTDKKITVKGTADAAADAENVTVAGNVVVERKDGANWVAVSAATPVNAAEGTYSVTTNEIKTTGPLGFRVTFTPTGPDATKFATSVSTEKSNVTVNAQAATAISEVVPAEVLKAGTPAEWSVTVKTTGDNPAGVTGKAGKVEVKSGDTVIGTSVGDPTAGVFKLQVKPLKAGASESYTVTFTPDPEAPYAAPSASTVSSKPVEGIVTSPPDAEAVDDGATFSVVVQGDATKYVWESAPAGEVTKDTVWTSIQGAESNPLVLKNLTADDNGKHYRVKVTIGGAEHTSAPATLTFPEP